MVGVGDRQLYALWISSFLPSRTANLCYGPKRLTVPDKYKITIQFMNGQTLLPRPVAFGRDNKVKGHDRCEI